jgi:putative transposase
VSVPGSTILDIPQAEQDAYLAAIRRSRYGYLLSLHILLLCARGKTPTEIADFLLCSRSSVYRTVKAYRKGKLGLEWDEDGSVGPPIRTTVLLPWLRRSMLAMLKKPPSVYGWCRTRWSCAALAAQLKASRGIDASAETVRRWLHELDWAWKRPKPVARDDDPERVDRLAKIRFAFEHLGTRAVMVFADELDIHLLSKIGYEWMPRGQQREVATPGKNEKRYLAGALELRTGRMLHCVWWRKVNGLFIDLLRLLDGTYAMASYDRIYVVVDNYGIHKAAAVKQWLSGHPRFELLFLPTYCPRANPIERCFGDVHDKCTRNHRRKRIRDLVKDVDRHIETNGPWAYKLSEIYYTPEVTAAVRKLETAELPIAA